ncbi:hypothetical protein MMC17_007254 [Xylographa soralifera]|nr:hypothetical protein [Xylographa soralifera]
MATVIVGAGIIGSATAFYLTQPPSTAPASSIHLVETSPELFASASGHAAGFLARDWFSPSLASLGALSFDLHKKLAKQNNGAEKWGYCRSTGTSLAEVKGKRGDEWLRDGTSRAEAAATHEFMEGSGPAWLTRSRNGDVEVISEDDSTAQVFVTYQIAEDFSFFDTFFSDPLRLSHFLLSTCLERGVQLHQPCQPLSVNNGSKGNISSITITSSADPEKQMSIPCSRLIITAGAWTPRVFETLFPNIKKTIPITSLAGHSLLIRSPRWNIGDETKGEGGCHAVFTTDETGYSPEIFSRVGGEIYIAGLNSAALPLPKRATDRKIDEKSIEVLKATAKRLLGKDNGDDDLEILREGLCFRPVSGKGVPILGKVDEGLLGVNTEGGVWIAAGHGPWGISLSLGTGKVISEMVEGRQTSANVRKLAL